MRACVRACVRRGRNAQPFSPTPHLIPSLIQHLLALLLLLLLRWTGGRRQRPIVCAQQGESLAP